MVFIKKYKSITPGTRFKVSLKNKKLKKNKFSKKLISKLNKTGGRNNLGRVTVRGRGGGHKRRYRNVLFKRKLFYGSVCSFEYDPNRSAFLAKVYSFNTSEYFYILAPKNLLIGDEINYSNLNNFNKILVGDSMLLKYIPVGSLIHNIELMPGKGGQFVRTAGNFAQLVEKVNNFAKVRLNSGEQRLIPLNCFASFGMIDNSDHRLVNLGKAGSKRWLGRRSKVRGVAMNPVDHPHGGGEGKTSGGRSSVTPNGRCTKGQPTRKKPLGKNIIISARVLRNLKKSSNRRGKFI
jgi:large subunit ribosomal protein L2